MVRRSQPARQAHVQCWASHRALERRARPEVLRSGIATPPYFCHHNPARLRLLTCLPACLPLIQDAVADLMGPAEEAACAARALFKSAPRGGEGARGATAYWSAGPARRTCAVNWRDICCIFQIPTCLYCWQARPTSSAGWLAAGNSPSILPRSSSPDPPPHRLSHCCRRGRPGALAGAHQRGGRGRGVGARRPPRHPVRGRGQEACQGVLVG